MNLKYLGNITTPLVSETIARRVKQKRTYRFLIIDAWILVKFPEFLKPRILHLSRAAGCTQAGRVIKYSVDQNVFRRGKIHVEAPAAQVGA